ncbi:MAG: hypothetical protein HQL81_04465, partial [Magnetococcales bacterium]|nr:hypothetical protein [Magnetococcales bacterium]
MKNKFKNITIINYVAISTTFISSCGGGGEEAGDNKTSTTTNTENVDKTKQPSSISGVVLDGPVTGAKIIVTDAKNVEVDIGEISSDGNARFSIKVPVDKLFPLHIKTKGGVDHATDEPSMPLDSIVFDASQTTAHITPQTSIIYQATIAKFGNDLSTADKGAINSFVAETKKNVVKKFGFGIDTSSSDVDPLTSDINDKNKTDFLWSSEAAAEVVRRVAKNYKSSNASRESIFQAIGEDISDGTIDGKLNNTQLKLQNELGGGDILLIFNQYIDNIKSEVDNKLLTITKNDGSSLSVQESNQAIVNAAKIISTNTSATSITTTSIPGTLSQNHVQKTDGSTSSTTTISPTTDNSSKPTESGSSTLKTFTGVIIQTNTSNSD